MIYDLAEQQTFPQIILANENFFSSGNELLTRFFFFFFFCFVFRLSFISYLLHRVQSLNSKMLSLLRSFFSLSKMRVKSSESRELNSANLVRVLSLSCEQISYPPFLRHFYLTLKILTFPQLAEFSVQFRPNFLFEFNLLFSGHWPN